MSNLLKFQQQLSALNNEGGMDQGQPLGRPDRNMRPSNPPTGMPLVADAGTALENPQGAPQDSAIGRSPQDSAIGRSPSADLEGILVKLPPPIRQQIFPTAKQLGVALPQDPSELTHDDVLKVVDVIKMILGSQNNPSPATSVDSSKTNLGANLGGTPPNQLLGLRDDNGKLVHSKGTLAAMAAGGDDRTEVHNGMKVRPGSMSDMSMTEMADAHYRKDIKAERERKMSAAHSPTANMGSIGEWAKLL